MSENVKETTDTNFESDVLKSDLPVLVDFWAPWCGPCKAIAPVLDELAKEYSAKIKIIKINVDDNPRSPTNYSVKGIPSLIFFKKGQVVEQIRGAVAKDVLVKAIEKVVA